MRKKVSSYYAKMFSEIFISFSKKLNELHIGTVHDAVLMAKFKDSYQHTLETCKCKKNCPCPVDILLTTDCFATKHRDLTVYQKTPRPRIYASHRRGSLCNSPLSVH